MFENIFGTIEENMACALDQDEFIKQNPNDPYVPIAKGNVDYYLDCAARLEKGINKVIMKAVYHHKYRT